MKFISSKKWLFFSLFVLITGMISLAVLKRAPHYKGLIWLCVYSIPSHVYISVLPHEPVLLYVGKLYNVFLVVLAAGVGTFIAGFIDYETLGRALNYKTIKNLYHDKQFYRKAVDLFNKAPFLVIVVAALTPVPYYPIKLLSLASNYPEGRYLCALTVGRVPRYFLLAYAGIALNVPNWILLVLFVCMFILAFAKRGLGMLKSLIIRIAGKRGGSTQDEVFQ